jgi:hypothetical protein
MATLTKEELKNALLSHGAPVPPASAKKEEFLQAYEEHIAPLEDETGGFSSNDEDPTSPGKKKANRSKLSTSSRKSIGSPKKSNKVVVEETEDVEMTVDISSLDDDQLFEMLQKNGVTAGPIVGSTRKFYEKKLGLALSGGTNVINGNEFSDTEPEEEEDDQPAVEVVPERRTTRSKVTSSPLSESGLRQRLTLGDELDSSEGLVSPRRAIHSYKVTESTRQVTTRAKDGSETVDTRHSVERTESSGAPAQKSFISSLLYPLLKLVILIILLVGLYVVFTTPSDGVTPMDKVIESINSALPPPETVEEVVMDAHDGTDAPPVVAPAQPLPDAGSVVDV